MKPDNVTQPSDGLVEAFRTHSLCACNCTPQESKTGAAWLSWLSLRLQAISGIEPFGSSSPFGTLQLVRQVVWHKAGMFNWPHRGVAAAATEAVHRARIFLHGGSQKDPRNLRGFMISNKCFNTIPLIVCPIICSSYDCAEYYIICPCAHHFPLDFAFSPSDCPLFSVICHNLPRFCHIFFDFPMVFPMPPGLSGRRHSCRGGPRFGLAILVGADATAGATGGW